MALARRFEQLFWQLFNYLQMNELIGGAARGEEDTGDALSPQRLRLLVLAQNEIVERDTACGRDKLNISRGDFAN